MFYGREIPQKILLTMIKKEEQMISLIYGMTEEILQVNQTGLSCYKYGFISKSGFCCREAEDRILIDLEALYRR